MSLGVVLFVSGDVCEEWTLKPINRSRTSLDDNLEIQSAHLSLRTIGTFKQQGIFCNCPSSCVCWWTACIHTSDGPENSKGVL